MKLVESPVSLTKRQFALFSITGKLETWSGIVRIFLAFLKAL